ncbi:MAG: hypothetical protein R2857_08470 [Vampirovibrionales bacterium]
MPCPRVHEGQHYPRAGGIILPGGDIFDIYPVNGDPVRLEFFGDTIETIRAIDIETQRSVDAIKSLTMIQRTSVMLDGPTKTVLIDRLLDRYWRCRPSRSTSWSTRR